MKITSFNKLTNELLTTCIHTLIYKGKEYSTDKDKLENFKRAGAMLDQHPAQALRGMKAKHDISILDIIDQVAEGQLPTKALLEEKIKDSINYLILLYAIIIEEIDKQ